MGSLNRSPAPQRRLTDENSGIAKDSRIRAPLIAGELIVYGLQLSLQADDFQEKQDNRTVGRRRGVPNVSCG